MRLKVWKRIVTFWNIDNQNTPEHWRESTMLICALLYTTINKYRPSNLVNETWRYDWIAYKAAVLYTKKILEFNKRESIQIMMHQSGMRPLSIASHTKILANSRITCIRKNLWKNVKILKVELHKNKPCDASSVSLDVVFKTKVKID